MMLATCRARAKISVVFSRCFASVYLLAIPANTCARENGSSMMLATCRAWDKIFAAFSPCLTSVYLPAILTNVPALK